MPFRGKYPINAVCTTGLVADLVRVVGVDYVTPRQLIRADVDPHLYKVSAGDMGALNSADIIFYSGLGLEAKLGDLFTRLAGGKPTYAVTQYIEEAELLNSDNGERDPHVWLDVMLWRKAVDVVRDALVLFDPVHADIYRNRAAEYSQQLEQLNANCLQRLAGIPSKGRLLITAHDAFRYFGRAYHFEVRGVQGTSTINQAGPRAIDQLINFVADRKVSTLFVETTVPDRGITALIEGCRAKGQSVGIGGPLYSDCLGPAGSPPGTYIGMVNHNIERIVEALK
jgi:manganese/zinc/iron transport system substrate-binding protein